MQPTGLGRFIQPNGAPRTSNDKHRSTGFIVVSRSPVSRVHTRLGRVGRLSSLFSISSQMEVPMPAETDIKGTRDLIHASLLRLEAS